MNRFEGISQGGLLTIAIFIFLLGCVRIYFRRKEHWGIILLFVVVTLITTGSIIKLYLKL